MHDKKYVFKPYNPIFPALFCKEKERLARFIETIAIEHVGSTAVPGLGGKGIIDIALAVKKGNLDKVCEKLQTLGYEYRPNFSTKDRYYFIIYLPDPEEGSRRYHIHLTYPENEEWKNFLSFRDYLIAHPEDRDAYAEIKRKAALDANHEGEKYREMKKPFIDKIVRESKKHS